MAAPMHARGRHVSGSGVTASRARHVAADSGDVGRRVSLVLRSAVLPGWGHLAAGHRRAGRVILAGVLVLLVLGVGVAGVTVLSPATTASFAVRPSYLGWLRGGAIAVAAAWILVVVSTVFLRDRRRAPYGVPTGTRARAVALTLAAVLSVGIAVPSIAVSRYAGTTKTVVEDVFPEPPDVVIPGRQPPRHEVFSGGRLNVLLIGGDAGSNRTGLRADTVILASVNTETGKAVLFSLPRNLQNVPFPEGSPMAQAWPDGFNCGNDCLLNAIYEWADEHRDLFPGDPDPGMTALRSAVSETLGLPVDYHVLVDLGGFQRLIDALGGVTIRVERPIPIGGGSSPITGYVQPGLQHLDGYHALWYARSRADSDDYQRVDRQRCLMGAIAREADPATVLVNYQKVASSTKDAVETDIPRSILPELVKIGFKVKTQPIESLTFTPPLVPNTADPDFDRIRRLVREAIERADAPPSPTPTPTPSARPRTPDDTGEPTPTPGETATAGSPDKPVALEDVCSYT